MSTSGLWHTYNVRRLNVACDKFAKSFKFCVFIRVKFSNWSVLWKHDFLSNQYFTAFKSNTKTEKAVSFFSAVSSVFSIYILKYHITSGSKLRTCVIKCGKLNLNLSFPKIKETVNACLRHVFFGIY